MPGDPRLRQGDLPRDRHAAGRSELGQAPRGTCSSTSCGSSAWTSGSTRSSRRLHAKALSAGKWKGTPAVHDRVEYWAEGVLAYFDAAGTGMTPTDADHPITTREALKEYDPDLFALVDETMAYKGKVDWR